MTQSRQFVNSYIASDMVKDHSDNQIGNPLSPLHVSLFPISSELYAPPYRQNNTYYGFCYTSYGALVEQEIAQWVHQGAGGGVIHTMLSYYVAWSITLHSCPHISITLPGCLYARP